MKQIILISGIIGIVLAASVAHAQDPQSEEVIKKLLQRVEELEQKVKALEAAKAPVIVTNDTKAQEQVQVLDQKVKVLERQRELDEEAAEARAKEAPKIIAGANGFAFGSADGSFNVQFHGLLQVDSRSFFDDNI